VVTDLQALALAPESAGSDPVTDRILAAALEQFEIFGLRRSTVEDVARRSGLSRMTVYRRFRSKQALLSAVIIRELQLGLARIDSAVSSLDSFEERLVEGFVVALELGRSHVLLQRLLRHEPDMVLPYVTVAGSPGLALIRDHLAWLLQQQRLAGGGRVPAPEAVAELLVRIGQSLLLTPETSLGLETEDGMRRFAREYLVRLVDGQAARA
jgi:AcrR family transcriptional regulator